MPFLTVLAPSGRYHGTRDRRPQRLLDRARQALRLVRRWPPWGASGRGRNWLRVLGTAELPHIDQGVRQQFHAKVSLLHVFKTKQQPLEFVLPRKGPIDTGSQGVDGGIK
jgi:hypothetical protein